MSGEKQVSRKVGRPSSASDTRVAEPSSRPNRNSAGGYRNKLTVLGQNPDYNYRWVADIEENGVALIEAQQNGYTYARADEHKVGDNFVYKPEDGGSSVIRIPAGKGGGFLYLMRIRKDWYDEYQEEKRKARLDVAKVAQQRLSQEADGGVYGSIKIE